MLGTGFLYKKEILVHFLGALVVYLFAKKSFYGNKLGIKTPDYNNVLCVLSTIDQNTWSATW